MSEHLTQLDETGGWPKLKVSYRTDPEKIAALLPPGLEPSGDPIVQINVYCVPILGEPEYGVSTSGASFNGIDGLFCVGMGIDQEAAIFISQELNGQPENFHAISRSTGSGNMWKRCVNIKATRSWNSVAVQTAA